MGGRTGDLTFFYVLVLAGIELILFIVAVMVSRFRFRRKTMLVTHWCFSCQAVLTLSQGVFSFLLCSARGQARGAARVGRGQTQDS